MKKVGIITFYHKVLNYGANLQAYALCRYLNKKEIDAEQILYDRYATKGKVLTIKRLLNKGIIFLIKYSVGKVIKLVKKFGVRNTSSQHKKEYEKIIADRRESFADFNRIVPSGKKIYTMQNIHECINEYDAFITGSDQVWNGVEYYNPYYLDFVPEDKIKISYAASMTKSTLTKQEKKLVRKSLESFDGISVREHETVGILQNLTDKKVEVVLDPTLLLESSDWEEVCAERVVKDDYVFCYFLGDNHKTRELVKLFAAEKGLKIVDIPYASGLFNTNNAGFGDIQMEAISPQKFLSLIKYSTYVFTDSFHAVVFSFVFKKEFFVFNRTIEGSMNSRIKQITKILGLETRFCESERQQTLEYLVQANKIDYSVEFSVFEKNREVSRQFLEKHIVSFVE